MKLAAVALVALTLVTLTGCAPSTEDAYEVCFDKTTAEVLDRIGGDEVEVMLEAAKACEAAAKADPALFNATWLD